MFDINIKGAVVGSYFNRGGEFRMNDIDDRERNIQDAIDYHEQKRIDNLAENKIIVSTIDELKTSLSNIKKEKFNKLKAEIKENIKNIFNSALVNKRIGVLLPNELYYKSFYHDLLSFAKEDGNWDVSYDFNDKIISIEDSSIFLYTKDTIHNIRGAGFKDFYIDSNLNGRKNNLRCCFTDKIIRDLIEYSLYDSDNKYKFVELS